MIKPTVYSAKWKASIQHTNENETLVKEAKFAVCHLIQAVCLYKVVKVLSLKLVNIARLFKTRHYIFKCNVLKKTAENGVAGLPLILNFKIP